MKVNDILKKYSLVPKRYEKKSNAFIIDTNLGRYVCKKNGIKNEILDYLNTRSFDYMPKIINDNDEDYIIYEYLEDYDIPKEQKILDLINLVYLLHKFCLFYLYLDYQ